MGRVFLDGGQSGIRIELWAQNLLVKSLDLPGIRSHEDIAAQVAFAIAKALQGADAKEEWHVGAGVTGLTPAHGGADYVISLCPPNVVSVALAHDSATSYLGAMADGWGAVLAVGTGVVVTACSPTTSVRVDGWGHLLGDEGGGYSIGASGLRKALEAVDGRGPATALTDAVSARFGPTAELPCVIYEDPNRVAAIAAFSVDVANCAIDGDAVAFGIMGNAARALARSAEAALAAVGTTHRQASWAGTLIEASTIARDLLREELSILPQPITLVPPVGGPLDGARLLIALPTPHPLSPAVSRAERKIS